MDYGSHGLTEETEFERLALDTGTPLVDRRNTTRRV
jgi:hypothetical protein